MEMKMPSWLIQSTFVVLVTAVLALGYTVFYRLPDLEKKMDSVGFEQKDRLQKIEVAQERRFESFNRQLAAVRVNMLRLCSSPALASSDCSLAELVSVANTVSTQNAKSISRASFVVKGGVEPEVSSNAAREQLMAVTRLPSVGLSSDRQDIASAMAWAAAAKDAKWTLEDGFVSASFKNGSARFSLASDVPLVEAKSMVGRLNALTVSFGLRANGDSEDKPVDETR